MQIRPHILMILENCGFPEDTRVWMEANSLVEEGYRVSLICPTGEDNKRFEVVGGVNVYRYPAPWELPGFLGYLFEYGYSLICALVISLVIRIRHGFDAVHIHCPPDLNGLLGIFYRLLGSKFVVDLHDLSPELYQAQKEGRPNKWVMKGLGFFEYLCCQHADALIATNQSQQRVQWERGGAMPYRCYIVRNGPNEMFTQEGVRPRPELLREGQTIIGYVGTMGIQDGLDMLIRALHLLNLQRQDFHAYLVGSGTAMDSLKQLTAELGLDSRVTFAGFVPFDMIPSTIASFDICTTPDPSNPYNDSCTTIKTMEYMALGRPTVAFRTPENVLSAGGSALYADSLEHFAELLSQLADDPELREQMGMIGRQRVAEQLAWRFQSKTLLQLYADLFGGRRQPVTVRLGSSAPGPIFPDYEAPSEPTLDSSMLPVRFCHDQLLGEFLHRCLERDIQNSELSLSFRAFYKLRPLVPGTARRWVQSRRNRSLGAEENWYIPSQLQHAISQLDSPPGSIWPGQSDYALVLTHDVEELDGFNRILSLAEVEESLGLRSCWNIVPYKYRVDMGVIRELQARGHEVAVHGFNHDGRLFSSKKRFDRRAASINQVTDLWTAKGFRAPMVHRQLHWMQALHIAYDSSCFDIDPFQAMPGGVQNIWPFQVGRFVELPYTLPQDHTLLITLQERTSRIWRHKLDFIRQNHGMALMLTHPDYLDNPERVGLYQEFLQHARSQGRPWHVLPGELADWFLQTQAPGCEHRPQTAQV